MLVLGLCTLHFLLEVNGGSAEDYERTYYAIPGNVSELHPECSSAYCAPFESLLQNNFSLYTRLFTGVYKVEQTSVVEIWDAKRICITGTTDMKDKSVTVDYNIVCTCTCATT